MGLFVACIWDLIFISIPKSDRNRYSPEVKLAAIKDRLNGVPMIDIMRRYQIASRNRIKSWCAQYAKQGPSAFGKNKQQ